MERVSRDGFYGLTLRINQSEIHQSIDRRVLASTELGCGAVELFRRIEKAEAFAHFGLILKTMQSSTELSCKVVMGNLNRKLPCTPRISLEYI
jgi:hypothetical protein